MKDGVDDTEETAAAAANVKSAFVFFEEVFMDCGYFLHGLYFRPRMLQSQL